MRLVGVEYRNIDLINDCGINCLISTIIELATGNIKVTVTMKPYIEYFCQMKRIRYLNVSSNIPENGNAHSRVKHGYFRVGLVDRGRFSLF